MAKSERTPQQRYDKLWQDLKSDVDALAAQRAARTVGKIARILRDNPEIDTEGKSFYRGIDVSLYKRRKLPDQ